MTDLPLDTIIEGDCLQEMAALPDACCDAVVTDPPAGIAFMGKEWDKAHGGRDGWIAAMSSIAAEVLRVAKPGAHALVWALPRTSHWTATAWENAGWEVRDRLAHLFGSGFPKSCSISKQLDKQEQNKWLNLGKALDSASHSDMMEAWIKHSRNAKSVGLAFTKSPTEAGSNTPKSDSVPAPAVPSTNLARLPVNAIAAELSSSEALHTNGANWFFAPSNAGVTITELSGPVIIAARPSASQEATRSTEASSVPCGAWDFLAESMAGKPKAVAALRTWLGSKKSSSAAGTSALCAALTDDLKLIILSQSETFLKSDTTQQMAFASATSVTITESTAASLISFTVATAKREAIDKAAGAEREVVGSKLGQPGYADTANTGRMLPQSPGAKAGYLDITAPATDAAKQWDGWGTALKPACEDWWLLRKPLSEKMVAANVLRWGTGGLNVDGCRVECSDHPGIHKSMSNELHEGYRRPWRDGGPPEYKPTPTGRWPANVITDGSEEVVGLFPQSKDGVAIKRNMRGKPFRPSAVGFVGKYADDAQDMGYGGSGSAARFFYQAKAARRERWFYCRDCEAAFPETERREHGHGHADAKGRQTWKHIASHPTVKPIALMAYLCRLVTPPGGIVLDPFAGSGSTCIAAIQEGFHFVGIEREAEYVEIARRRLAAQKTLFAAAGD